MGSRITNYLFVSFIVSIYLLGIIALYKIKFIYIWKKKESKSITYPFFFFICSILQNIPHCSLRLLSNRLKITIVKKNIVLKGFSGLPYSPNCTHKKVADGLISPLTPIHFEIWHNLKTFLKLKEIDLSYFFVFFFNYVFFLAFLKFSKSYIACLYLAFFFFLTTRCLFPSHISFGYRFIYIFSGVIFFRYSFLLCIDHLTRCSITS